MIREHILGYNLQLSTRVLSPIERFHFIGAYILPWLGGGGAHLSTNTDIERRWTSTDEMRGILTGASHSDHSPHALEGLFSHSVHDVMMSRSLHTPRVATEAVWWCGAVLACRTRRPLYLETTTDNSTLSTKRPRA
jgi:hypothetical protein